MWENRKLEMQDKKIKDEKKKKISQSRKRQQNKLEEKRKRKRNDEEDNARHDMQDTKRQTTHTCQNEMNTSFIIHTSGRYTDPGLVGIGPTVTYSSLQALAK